eukprot:TRINITY_DN7311_c0_g1_i3.p1 TRINITY_DN7311_c0_g1~~TRINITY_DN7311_c0_g1_i3.p1  ORF type:complete len:307 (-),score=20.69 TRINITY_DN7311_c0_g1_i3:34-954(-)
MTLGLFDCSGFCSCAESMLMAILVLASAYKFFLAYRKISKDTSNIIDETDRLIFYIAFAQIIILAIFFIVFKSSFLIYSMKATRMAQDILVCAIIATLWVEESYQGMIKKAGIFLALIDSLIWFIAVFGVASHETYECNRPIWIFYSIAIMLTSLLSAFLGYQVRQLTNRGTSEYLAMQENTTANTAHMRLHLVNLDEMNKRRIQVEILFVGNVVSALVQVIWDFHSYSNVQSASECYIFYESQSNFMVIVLLLVKSIAWLLPTWTIYYIFYYRNHSYFNTIDKDHQRTLSAVSYTHLTLPTIYSV